MEKLQTGRRYAAQKQETMHITYKQVAATQLKAIMDTVKERLRRGLFVANASKNKFLSSVGAVC